MHSSQTTTLHSLPPNTVSMNGRIAFPLPFTTTSASESELELESSLLLASLSSSLVVSFVVVEARDSVTWGGAGLDEALTIVMRRRPSGGGAGGASFLIIWCAIQQASGPEQTTHVELLHKHAVHEMA